MVLPIDRGDYNSLTFSDHFGSMFNYLYIITLMQCRIKLRDNMAIDGFWPIISTNL